MKMVISTGVISLMLGFGALQELYVVGIQGGQVQPFWVGAFGAFVCLLLAASGVALWRKWKGARGFAISAALLFVAFHVYASMPPHRNVGVGMALVAFTYGLGFLIFAVRQGRVSHSTPSRQFGN